MDYTQFKEEIDHDELLRAMRILWHEIQTSEGTEAWILINDFINK